MFPQLYELEARFEKSLIGIVIGKCSMKFRKTAQNIFGRDWSSAQHLFKGKTESDLSNSLFKQ